MQYDELVAPFAYKNWKANLGGQPWLRIEEYPLYSDANGFGQIPSELGPYRLIRLIRRPNQCGLAQQSLVFRFIYHNEENVSPATTEGTWSETYHGGWPVDEIVALVSLTLGVRLKAGDMSRKIVREADPIGTPTAYGFRGEPVIPWGNSRLVLPNICGPHSPIPAGNENYTIISTLPTLDPSDATALIRAARLYQDAIWIAESETSLAWVMLVSAIETAACQWRTADDDPLEAIKALDSDLFDLLRDSGNHDLVQKVARRAAKTLKSTKRFIDFGLEFLPPPPPLRPNLESEQHRWSRRKLRKSLRDIYGYRSTALHDGRPFPAPMCVAPLKSDGNSRQEVPTWRNFSTRNSTWLAEDIPMFLHTFEYFVRQSLLKWWKSMVPES